MSNSANQADIWQKIHKACREKNYAVGKEFCDQILAEGMKDPDSKVAFFVRALYFFERKEFESAIKDLGSAIALDADYADAYYHRGHSYFELKKYQLALVDFLIYHFLRPELDLPEERGICQVALRNYRAAISDLKIVIENGQARQTDCRALLWRSYCYLELGDLESAFTDASTYLALTPHMSAPFDKFMYFLRGQISYKLGNLEDAISDFDSANSRRGNDYRIYEQRGIVCFDQEKFVEAKEDFTMAIGTDPEFPSPILLRRAVCFRKLGQLREAERDVTVLISHLKGDSNLLSRAYQLRRDIRLETNNMLGARRDQATLRKRPLLQAINCDTRAQIPLNSLYDESIMLARHKQRYYQEFFESNVGSTCCCSYSMEEQWLLVVQTKSNDRTNDKTIRLLGDYQLMFELHMVGYFELSGEGWIWAWADKDVPFQTSRLSRKIRDIGRARGVKELQIDRFVRTDPHTIEKFRAIAMALSKDAFLTTIDFDDHILFILVKNRMLRLPNWSNNLHELHRHFYVVTNFDPVTNQRLVLTSYLRQRQISFSENENSVRVNGKTTEYLHYTFDADGTVLSFEFGA